MEEENTKGVENAKIFVRILPVATACDCVVKIGDNKKDIYVRSIQDMKRDKLVKSENPVYWQFPTDGIFYNNSQDDMYREVTRDLLTKILDGANCVLVSYGQTGTGKSFTIAGLRNNYEHRGIIARFLSDMFEEKRSRKYSNFIEYRLNCVEIVSNKLRDLLSAVDNDKQEKLKSTSDAVKNVTSVMIKSEEEALKKIFECEARKRIEEGDNYDASHQGTSIVTFHVSNRSLITSWAVTTHSKIHMVDMAGIDSVGKANCRKTIEQVRNANLDKAQMEQLILDLQKSKKPAMHRQGNNLLKYLSGEFNLGSLLRFVAHIRPTEDDIVTTLSTLRFGSNVKKLKPKKIRQAIGELGEKLEIKKLREEVATLKEELEINDILLRQEPIENISTARAEQIERAAIDFVNGSLDDLTLISISQAQILLRTFRNMIKKLEQDHQIGLQQAARDAHDFIAKDSKCSSLSVTKLSKTALIGNNNGKTKRKNKPTAAVDRLPKVLTTSQVSIEGEDETMTKEKVGELIDSGITVGPGRLEPAFGPVVKLMNIKRYGEPQSRPRTFPHSNLIETSSAEIISKNCNDFEKSMIDNEEALKLFLREDEEAIRLNNELKEAELARKSGQKTINDLISKYKEIKTELEISRIEFEKQQNARHLTGKEFYDDQGRVIIPELEIEWLNVVKRFEEELIVTECRIHRAEEELKDLLNSELDAIYKIESAFQNFSDKLDDHRLLLPIIFGNNSTSNPNNTDESLRERPADEIEIIKSKFIEMQDMMKLMIQNKSTSKLGRRREI